MNIESILENPDLKSIREYSEKAYKSYIKSQNGLSEKDAYIFIMMIAVKDGENIGAHSQRVVQQK